MFEAELLRLFRKLSPRRQELIISFLRGFAGACVSQKLKKEVKAYEGKR